MPTMLQFSHMTDADNYSALYPQSIDFATAGDNVLVSGIVGQRIYCYRILIVVGGDTNLTFKDGVGTNLTGAIPMLANGAIALDISNIPWFQTSNGKDFILGSSAMVQVSGKLDYQQK